MGEQVKKSIDDFFVWIETRMDAGGWVRRGCLCGAFGMTGWFMLWAMKFAELSARTGGDIALIIGAIGVPLSAVTGFAFRDYLDSRK